MIDKHILGFDRGARPLNGKIQPVSLDYRSEQKRRRLPPEGDPSRYLFVHRPRCPRCGHSRIRKYRTNPPETDGSRTCYAMCVSENCGWTGLLIEE